MATSYGKDGDFREPQVIEDVIVPTSSYAFDVRSPRVKHQSIGALDQQYLRARTLNMSGATIVYTRVPPLSTLPSLSYTTSGEDGRLAELLDNFKQDIKHGLISAKGLLAALLIAAWPTQKYEIDKGVSHEGSLSRESYIKGLVVAVFLIIGLACILWPTVIKPRNYGVNTPNPSTSQQSGTLTGNSVGSSTGNSAKGSTPYSAITSHGVGTSAGTAASSGSSAAGTTGSTSTTTVGKGGGSPNSGSGSSPVSTPSLPYTVSVPPVDVQADGKQVISTTGSNVTLN